MSTINTQIAKASSGPPKVAIGVLLAILLFGMYVVGYDQGQLFSLVEGQKAFDDMWMHEFYHDLRHAAGFPCH
jgi:Probable cobalt transporter subunit (CbtB)